MDVGEQVSTSISMDLVLWEVPSTLKGAKIPKEAESMGVYMKKGNDIYLISTSFSVLD